MGYIEQSLGANEVVHYRARLPWVLRAFGWLILALTLVAASIFYIQDLPLISASAGGSAAFFF